jgi:tetratricopeptide (TPR) repeat protein
MIYKLISFKIFAATLLLFILATAYPPSAIYAASPLKTINGINVSDIGSLKKMAQALDLMASTLSRSVSGSGATPFDFQKAVLTKSGECVSALVSLGGNAARLTPAIRQDKINLFLKNRGILSQILALNEKIIFDHQENTLDNLSDPLVFIRSPEWQNPQYLISLSSYWIGWNNYYTTLYFSNGGDQKNKLLDEAIKGFSRAFVDFEEDSVIARSLFGRGLCYRQKKAYVQAIQDLELVKQKVEKEDSLYLRCSYEVAWILYETGKYREALNRMDDIQSDYTGKKIPDEIDAGLTAMKSKILIASSGQAANDKNGDRNAAVMDESYIFNELKKMSSSYNGANELYRYSREKVDRLKKLSPAQLGPIAAIAVGDTLFDDTHMDDALAFYLPFYKERHAYLNDRMDGIWFRIAYTYCKKEQWDRAIVFLAPFAKKFPASSRIEEVASLYYVAASSRYAKGGNSSVYKTYIAAIRLYLNRCSSPCPYKDEAHFQLGRHYQKIGQEDRATAQFNRVGNDSPNRFLAKYHALQYYVDTLSSLNKADRKASEAWEKTYRNGTKCLKKYRTLASEHANDKSGKKIAPHMRILSADLLHYGSDSDIRDAIKILDGFEKQYPEDRQLVLKAMVIRVTGFYRLGMMSRMEKDISRFVSVDTPDRDRIDALHKLADNFFRDAESLNKKEFKEKSEKPYAMALMIYQKLAPFSCDKDSPDRFCGMTLLRMAKIHENENRFDEAEAAYLMMMEINPSSADAVYGLGLIYEKMREWDKALAIWRKFSDGMADGSPLWFESKYRTSQALANLGEFKKACDILTITMVLHPDLKDEEMTRDYIALKNRVCGAAE